MDNAAARRPGARDGRGRSTPCRTERPAGLGPGVGDRLPWFPTRPCSCLFVLYPVGYGLWLGRDPASYAELFADPIYLRTLVNTVLFLAIGVNLHLFLALLLSGYFMQKSRWIKALFLIFILPWARAGDTDLHLHPLDAERAMGADQQPAHTTCSALITGHHG